MGLRQYASRRVIPAIITFVAVIFLNFLLFHAMPGNPFALLLRDPRMPPEMREKLAHAFGLDAPLQVQFLYYVENIFSGNLGISLVYKVPVTTLVSERLLNTLILVTPATILSIVIGTVIGTLAGWKRGSKFESGALLSSLFVYSLPVFWLGMVFIMFFAVTLRWFPTSGIASYGVQYASILAYLSDLGAHLFLPTVVLTLVLLGQYALIMRSSVVDVLVQDYILTAKAKGFGDVKIIRDHVLKNALLPLVTLIGLNIGLIIGGAIQTETVFSYPGIGRLVFESIATRDYPVLEGAFLAISVSVILANLITDLFYAYLDPRVRY
jgi:peptide/nickel transport system permease protein